MKTATIEEVVSRPKEMLAGNESVMVLSGGKPASLVLSLRKPEDIPMEVRRQRYAEANDAVVEEFRAKGITQEQFDRDIADLLRKDRG